MVMIRQTLLFYLNHGVNLLSSVLVLCFRPHCYLTDCNRGFFDPKFLSQV
jgi:hypothetical protein